MLTDRYDVTWIVTSATVLAALELSLVAFLYLSMVAFTLPQLHKQYATGVSAHMQYTVLNYMHIHEGDGFPMNKYCMW